MQIGLEVEYWLVDASGDLASADPVVADCAVAHREFVEPLVEVKTPPCDSAEALLERFLDRLDRVRAAARRHDRRLVPLATPLADEPVASRDGDRVGIQRAVLGADLAHARHCAGTHLHLEATEPLQLLRLLTAIDPAIALVASAPYYRGAPVATCARADAYRRRCYRSMPAHGRLWDAPESVAAWRDRQRRRYEEFVEAATRAGVDREAVTAVFSPSDAIWTPVRLRDDLGTVEWRAPDAAPPRDLCRLVTDVDRVARRPLAGDASTPGDGRPVPSFDRLRDVVDESIADGLGSERVRRYLDRWGFSVEAYRPMAGRIAGLDEVDHEAGRRLRLRAADRLDRDLERLAGERPEAADTIPA